MAFLIVSGTTVSVPDGGISTEYLTIGDTTRSFDGTLRGTVRARKRKWTVSTIPMTQATADTLYTALIGTPPAACSGDVTGTVNCVVEVTAREYVLVSSGYQIVTRFTLDEV